MKKRKTKPVIEITSKTHAIMANFALKKLYKAEDQQHFNERSIMQMTDEMHQQTNLIMNMVYTFSKF